jgi:hypothetical protein
MSALIWLAYFPGLLKWLTRLVWGRRYRALMSQIVPGSYEYTGNFNRKLPIDEKFESIRGEFQGQSELSFDVVKKIIRLRRGFSRHRNWLFLYGAILNHPQAVFSGLTLRWIVSVLDTFGDMPCPRHYKLAAGTMRGFVLGLRLGYSIAVQSVKDPEVQDEPIHFFHQREIWAGIIHFDYKIGDTYRNYMTRTNRELRSMPAMAEAWRNILIKVARHPALGFALTHNERSRQAFIDATRDPGTR